jgi:hypothetical protein
MPARPFGVESDLNDETAHGRFELGRDFTMGSVLEQSHRMHDDHLCPDLLG